MKLPDTTRDQAFLLLALLCFFQALFAAVPQIDLWVSALFWAPGNGFLATESIMLKFFRELALNASLFMALIALIAVIISPWKSHPLTVPARVWKFILCLFVLGPGLLVNGLLKTYGGRARPANVMEFGGDLTFSPAFEFAGQCLRNCSFVSGEASGAMALMIAIFAIAARFQNQALQHYTQIGVVFLGLSCSVLRIVFGRHFLSDVIFGWLFVALIAIALARLFRIPATDALSHWPETAEAPWQVATLQEIKPRGSAQK